ETKKLDRSRRVFQRTPGASGTVVERRGGRSEPFLVLLRSPQADSCGEHVAEISGESFVDPKQVAGHRLLVVAGCEPARTAIFSIPRMRELMRDQPGF